MTITTVDGSYENDFDHAASITGVKAPMGELNPTSRDMTRGRTLRDSIERHKDYEYKQEDLEGPANMPEQEPLNLMGSVGQNFTPVNPAEKRQEYEQSIIKEHWMNMSPEDMRKRAREDADQNQIVPPAWRFDEYMKMWDEEREKSRREGPLFQMSPKQLRERGIGPSGQSEPTIDTSHNVESGAVASKTENKVYIAPNIPKEYHPFLARHETVEKRLMEEGMSYEKAHIQATLAEKQLVEQSGMTWKAYTDGVDPHIAEAEKAKGNQPKDPHVNMDDAIGHHAEKAATLEKADLKIGKLAGDVIPGPKRLTPTDKALDDVQRHLDKRHKDVKPIPIVPANDNNKTS